MKEKLTLREPKIILVEGLDDVKFFRALLKYLNIKNFQIIEVEGKNNFKTVLKIISQEVVNKLVSVIVCIRDADNNFSGAFLSIKNSLKDSKLPFPDKANTFNNVNDIKTGVYVLPANQETGMIEDLCMQTIDKDKKDCIEKYYNCLNIEVKNKSKSTIQIYLATQEPLTNSLGNASQEGIWNFNHECFAELKTFLENLK